MTLKGAIPLILRFYPISIALQANYITVVEDRLTCIISAKYCLQFLVFHFWPKLIHPTVLQRGLSTIAELLFISRMLYRN